MKKTMNTSEDIIKNHLNILMGTFNGEVYLESQLDSIFKQTYQNFKLIIRDDNSSDNTINILKKYKKKFPQKIEIHQNSNSPFGAKSNFSELIELAKAPYIMLCDQDDLWRPNKIELSLEKIKVLEEKYSSDIPILIHTDLEVIDKDANRIEKSFWKYSGLQAENNSLNRLLVQNVITGCTILFNRPLANLITPIPDTALMHDHWIALIASAVGKICNIKSPTVLYRQHEKNVLGAVKWSWNLKHLFNRVIKFLFNPKEKNIQNEYLAQAKSLRTHLFHLMKSQEKEILDAFITMKNAPYFKRILIVLKYKFLKGNWFKNIGLLIKG